MISVTTRNFVNAINLHANGTKGIEFGIMVTLSSKASEHSMSDHTASHASIRLAVMLCTSLIGAFARQSRTQIEHFMDSCPQPSN